MEEISHRSEMQPEALPEEPPRDCLANSNEQLESKEEYTNAATFGAETYLELKISLGKEPTREQWQEEFLYHVGIATGKEYLLDRLWKDVQAASMEYERLQGQKPVSEVLEQMLSREPPENAPPPSANIVKIQQSTKVIVPKAEGYRETLLESMLRCTFFPSSFFDQPVPVRGVCFAAGPDSSQLARNFAERRLALAVFSINHEAGTEMAWIEMCRVFTHPQTTFSRMGILLPNLDRTSVEAQQQLVEAMQTANNLLWFPSADDYRKVIPALRLALVVYLGLNAGNKMQVLVQSGQTLEIDQGSLEHPDLN